MDDIDFSTHHLTKSSREISDICQPLEDFFNTPYFNFVRRFEDHTEACLTTDPKWAAYFYKNKLYMSVLVDKFARSKTLVNRLKIIPWSQFSESPVRKAQINFSGIGTGLTLIFTKIGYMDFFYFGCENTNPEMAEVYINYADCLIQFSHYFYDAANKLIAQASLKENRIPTPSRSFKKDANFPRIKKFDIEKFLKTTQPKRFYIHDEITTTQLTKKEIFCITLSAQGKSAAEIGKVLFMSKRTVETHLKNSRNKLGLKTGSSKSDLIAELYKKGFDLNHLLLTKL